MKIFLVRHGQTEWNHEQRYQGHTDVSLDKIGIKQAELVAARLFEKGLKAVYSSDLQRASKTAQIIADVAGCPLHTTPLLREANFGEWEGKTRLQIQEGYPGLFDKYRADSINYRPPSGETLDEVRQRITEALTRIKEEVQDGSVAIVGHGGSLRWIIMDCLSAPIETYRRLTLDNGSLSLVQYESTGHWLSLFNDTSHLGALLSDATVSVQLNR